ASHWGAYSVIIIWMYIIPYLFSSAKLSNSPQGAQITLLCNYSTNDLYWYRQYPGSAPIFLELIFDGATNTKKSDVDPRLSVKLTKREQKHVDLIISSAAVSDSALFYCALRPTVTGNIWVPYKNPLPNEREQE
uniref:Immunoglobulin V-set domain-containing protein n=1 Tax=Sinocyclocheilus rhinocerous TaxID=307959 RepID=A0A673K3H6_9TELE